MNPRASSGQKFRSKLPGIISSAFGGIGMKSYRKPDIYNDLRKLAVEIHKMTLLLPKFELYEEVSQIRRSSKSVTARIVEGYGRKRYKGEFIKYVYSQAECDETIVHLDFYLIPKR